MEQEGVRSLWKGLTPFATHLTLKYALRMGTNAFYQSLLRDKVPPGPSLRWQGGCCAEHCWHWHLCTTCSTCGEAHLRRERTDGRLLTSFLAIQLMYRESLAAQPLHALA